MAATVKALSPDQYLEMNGPMLEEKMSMALRSAIKNSTDKPILSLGLSLLQHAEVQLSEVLEPALARAISESDDPVRAWASVKTQKKHVKARSQDNPEYPKRFEVPDELVAWDTPFPSYVPEEWTHQVVFANDREKSTGHKWADPPDPARAGLASRISYAGDGQQKPLTLDDKGTPCNPVGRTGLRGRGLLGKWGANHAADPIVTRNHPETGQLQMVSIQRKDTGQWGLPGGMVDDGEAVSAAVKREFEEEAGDITDPEMRKEFDAQVSILFSSGKQIYRGYIDDPRNTDNAWTETTAFHFHCTPDLGKRLHLKAGDDAGDVIWLDIDMKEEKYAKMYGAHRMLVEQAVSRR